MKDKKSIVTKEYGFLKVDGRYFRFDDKVLDRTCYVEVDKKSVEKKIKMMKEIAEGIKDNLDREAVLMESLSKLPEDYLEQIHNAVFNSKKKTKPKTRSHHCVDMKVGKLIIPIVD